MQLIYNTHSVSNIQTLETINYFNTTESIYKNSKIKKYA